MTTPTLACPCCGASMGVMKLERTGRLVLVCSDMACGHYEPLPAAYEVRAAGGERLPGMEEG